MKEFWLWVAIVTLILALLCGTLVAVFHVEKQLRKTEAMHSRQPNQTMHPALLYLPIPRLRWTSGPICNAAS